MRIRYLMLCLLCIATVTACYRGLLSPQLDLSSPLPTATGGAFVFSVNDHVSDASDLTREIHLVPSHDIEGYQRLFIVNGNTHIMSQNVVFTLPIDIQPGTYTLHPFEAIFTADDEHTIGVSYNYRSIGATPMMENVVYSTNITGAITLEIENGHLSGTFQFTAHGNTEASTTTLPSVYMERPVSVAGAFSDVPIPE